jgi:hypothetical protein
MNSNQVAAGQLFDDSELYLFAFGFIGAEQAILVKLAQLWQFQKTL